VKDRDSGLDLRPPPRTEPLLGLGAELDDFFGLVPLLIVATVVALVVALLVVMFGLR
jgi:hypothetical protein